MFRIERIRRNATRYLVPGAILLQVVGEGEGPLGGVITALLARSGDEVVAVLACDLVHPDPRVIAAVVTAAASPGVDVAVPVFSGRPHFHHAVWSQSALPLIRGAFDAGERAPRRVSALLRVAEVQVADANALADVDDPESFAAVRESPAR